MWYENAIIYHIYPLGFCNAQQFNDFKMKPINRIKKVGEWAQYLKDLGVNTVFLGPVFESSSHGYDTANYFKIDRRLGTNEDFKEVCKILHSLGIRIVLDGVFNHVGRNFWAFSEFLKNRSHKEWFNINLAGNSPYNDGFWYEGWEGHYELVKLNLFNKEVRDYLLSVIKFWIDEFLIDGIRFDVAYSLNHDFIKEVHNMTKKSGRDFWLMGEMIHGDYNSIMNDTMMDSVTNYECYKGIYSSFNSRNMFEIGYSLNRQFGEEGWSLYKNKLLYTFVDNHDVTRFATIIKEKAHIPLGYALMFAMPGIPSIYYGSEWGIEGEKSKGDSVLRPSLEKPIKNFLSDYIKKLCQIRKKSKALQIGSYKTIFQTNNQFAFLREYNGEKIVFAVNIDDKPYTINLKWINGENFLDGARVQEQINLKSFDSAFIKII
ncbi:MAG: alpha-amylase family glycosyl hydrolase [Clostridiaceae bacterium]|nr:alpha-amylase family glycosyl hydrolase [Clostridiaceae bacterium]